MLINAGVKEIVFSGDYPDNLAKKILEDSNIKLRIFNNKNNKQIFIDKNRVILKK